MPLALPHIIRATQYGCMPFHRQCHDEQTSMTIFYSSIRYAIDFICRKSFTFLWYERIMIIIHNIPH